MAFDPTNARHIALRLNPGQMSTILGLDDRPVILGCAEPCAIRLARTTPRRPALTQWVQGERYKLFSLTPVGVTVKAELENLA